MRRLLVGLMLVATTALASQGLWIDVPFVKQTRRACGAAAAAMVLRYWASRGYPSVDAQLSVAELHRRLYSKPHRGTLGTAIEKLLAKADLKTFVFRGEYADLASHLAQGRPLVVCLDPPGGGVFHFAVVVGLDPQADAVLLNDPARRKLARYGRDEFVEAWAATGFWSLLAVPETPATVPPQQISPSP